jgi:protein-S-isoprenylcysteine O-methyltransferase Ste14
VLPLVLVETLAAIGLVSTTVAILVGRSRASASLEPVRVVASRNPESLTQVAWIAGTLIVTLWPIVLFIAPGIGYHWPSFPDFADSWLVQLAGIGIGAAGGLLFVVAARALGRHMTPAIQVREGHELVQTGPYRVIRHPVYTAIMALAIGQALFYLSLPVGVIAILLVVLAGYRARLEESLLRSPEAFGGTYDAYMARTGRFLPRLLPRSSS